MYLLTEMVDIHHQDGLISERLVTVHIDDDKLVIRHIGILSYVIPLDDRTKRAIILRLSRENNGPNQPI